jgi:acyl-CoA reductase-like NAD-dependent aldehyde dehydrogenase
VKMFVAGEWRSGTTEAEVRSPYTGEVLDTVPVATVDDVDQAIFSAEQGAQVMAALPAYRRAEILHRVANIVEANIAELAKTITSEEGKPLSEATLEATRVPPLFRLCAEEAGRIYGEVLPMDSADYGMGRLGFTLLEPCGIVAAVTPFNFPARLVVFKVGPAIAAGNSVVLKPASATPLTALLLVRYLLEAGLPESAIQALCGPGPIVGEAICADRRIRKVSFTGSKDVGERIAKSAGLKRITCEMGSNVAVVVLDDADVKESARAIARDGYSNGGQVCISAQRVVVSERVGRDLVADILERVDRLIPGDPMQTKTTLGPLISEREADRVVSWIDEARASGAQVLRGGGRTGALVEPAVVLEPSIESRIWREELFGPGIAVRSVANEKDALRVANDTRYGLAVSVFTRDLDRALHFARELHSGVVHINHGPNWRADFMPYGGVGDSGYGKEGVKYSIAEMTETKMVVIHPHGDA